MSFCTVLNFGSTQAAHTHFHTKLYGIVGHGACRRGVRSTEGANGRRETAFAERGD